MSVPGTEPTMPFGNRRGLSHSARLQESANAVQDSLVVFTSGFGRCSHMELQSINGQRPAEQESLEFVATRLGKEPRLPLGLYAFGNHGDIQSLGKLDDGDDNGTITRVAVSVDDEAAVDLEVVHRKLPQIVER